LENKIKNAKAFLIAQQKFMKSIEIFLDLTKKVAHM